MTSKRKKKADKEDQAEEPQTKHIKKDENTSSSTVTTSTTPEETIDFSSIDVNSLRQEFDELDDKIMEMEGRRQEVLRILKAHPLTQVQYSIVNRWEKTKEMRSGARFHALSADCLGLVLGFLLTDQLLDLETFKKLSSLSMNFREALCNYTPFILVLNKKIVKFNEKVMPDITGLGGIEFATFENNVKIVETLANTCKSLRTLVIRNDLCSDVPKLSTTLSSGIKLLKFVETHDKSKKTLDFSQFTSVEDFYLCKYQGGVKATDSIKFPPAVKRFIFSFPHSSSPIRVKPLFAFEHVTLCFLDCGKASNNIRDSNIISEFRDSECKTLRLFRLVSKTKKPDPLETLLVNHTIYCKNFDAAKNKTKEKAMIHATFKSNVSSLTEILDTEFSVAYSEELNTTIPSTEYIDAYYSHYKQFKPDLRYDWD